MTNIKSFLEGGQYVPPNSLSASSSTGASMLHINRVLKDIDPNRPMRFVLVEGPEQFKPEYWSRVVAVFTTGQSWQFKNYKWQAPADLFSHALGVYVGWQGEVVPDTIKAWGRGVLSAGLDKGHARWRDRDAWGRSAVLNVANMGWFSSDRTIAEYARDIWGVM